MSVNIQKHRRLLLTSLCLFASTFAQKFQWYYTGKVRNDAIKDKRFQPTETNVFTFFNPTSENTSLLYFGGVIASYLSHNITLDEVIEQNINRVLMFSGSQSTRDKFSFSVINSTVFELVTVIDYGTSNVSMANVYSMEIGLYDLAQDVFVEYRWHDIKQGKLHALHLKIDGIYCSEDHYLLLNEDTRRKTSLNLHTWKTQSCKSMGETTHGEGPRIVTHIKNDEVTLTAAVAGLKDLEDDTNSERSDTFGSINTDNPAIEVTKSSPTTVAVPLRVMTYNLWHNNPPSWVYRDAKERWYRYDKRLSHFADIIASEQPDILMIQEVRLDANFQNASGQPNARGNPFAAPSAGSGGADGGSQMQHLLTHLRGAYSRRSAAVKKDVDGAENSGRCLSRDKSKITKTQVAVGVTGELLSGELEQQHNEQQQEEDDDRSCIGSAPRAHVDNSSEDFDGSFHFVFQPAMSMFDKSRPSPRSEEGVAILSRWPIVEAEALLLPRALTDKSDDHQRVVLRVRVRVPVTSCGPGENEPCSSSSSSSKSVLVDAFTTHLSLSSQAREASASEIRRFAQRTATATLEDQPALLTPGAATMGVQEATGGGAQEWLTEKVGPHITSLRQVVQILSGDLNAEPHEEAIRILRTGIVSTVGGGDSDGGSNGDGIERDSVGKSETAMPPLENHAPSTDDRNWEFVDLWTHTHNLSSHSESGVAGTESDISRNHDDDLGLTFPACNPIKRIDYLFLHRASAERDWGDRMDSEVQVEVIGTHIAGVRPTADTEHLVGSRPGLGMLDEDSPVWASDHFALVADLLLHVTAG